jgi:hypothetical protein
MLTPSWESYLTWQVPSSDAVMRWAYLEDYPMNNDRPFITAEWHTANGSKKLGRIVILCEGAD